MKHDHDAESNIGSNKGFGDLHLMSAMSIGCLTSLVFGFSFMLIYFGIMHLFPLIIGYWKPAHQIFTQYFPKIPSQRFSPPPLTFWRIVSLIPAAAVSLTYFWIGFWTIFKFGFLRQNLIYIFLRYVYQLI